MTKFDATDLAAGSRVLPAINFTRQSFFFGVKSDTQLALKINLAKVTSTHWRSVTRLPVLYKLSPEFLIPQTPHFRRGERQEPPHGLSAGAALKIIFSENKERKEMPGKILDYKKTDREAEWELLRRLHQAVTGKKKRVGINSRISEFGALDASECTLLSVVFIILLKAPPRRAY